MTSIQILKQNYQNVVDRIERAAEKADRDPASIRLVAVTKYVDAQVVRMLYDLGCQCFGESRPQVLWQKNEDLADLDIEWHMIGHLQTNKVRRTLTKLELLHSGDSLKLLEIVNEESKRNDVLTRILCEVNISGDPAKHGFAPSDLNSAFDSIAKLENLRVVGLMAMASRVGGPDRARQDFESMASLHEQLKTNLPESISLKELSMGMSGDFEQAIANGATLVRVGSVLFDGI